MKHCLFVRQEGLVVENVQASGLQRDCETGTDTCQSLSFEAMAAQVGVHSQRCWISGVFGTNSFAGPASHGRGPHFINLHPP